MKTLLRVRPALGLVIVALMVLAGAPPVASGAAPVASSARQAAGWLRISPGLYVGGQSLVFKGNIGRRGIQRIHVEANMGTAPSGWSIPHRFRTRTRADGSFRFRFPAPASFNLYVRVASAGAATPVRKLSAASQEVVLHTVAPGLEDGQVRAGEPFRIDVDTTPEVRGRSDLPGPVFKGRTLTLQERVLDDAWHTSDWHTLDTTVTDDRGRGSFVRTVNDPGTVVYRVREENWTATANQIGWFPSFPTYVDVRPLASTRQLTGAAPETAAAVTGESRSARVTEGMARGLPYENKIPTAAQRFGWRPALWDFDWGFGASLTSRPHRGTHPRGWWLDTSDGTGRAAKHNGGLMLESQLNPFGSGDRGTTSATLRDNAQTYGRWETKLRLKSRENNAQDYRARVELIPDRPRDYHCGAQNITIAEVTAHGSSVSVGAKALQGDREWRYRRPLASLTTRQAAFAVEVARGHISWFVNGRVIATVNSRAAVSDVPMTMRMSLVGDGQQEMNRTETMSDWQRGFSLDRGRQVTSGHRLRLGTHGGGC
jgi:hypothetical protein